MRSKLACLKLYRYSVALALISLTVTVVFMILYTEAEKLNNNNDVQLNNEKKQQEYNIPVSTSAEAVISQESFEIHKEQSIAEQNRAITPDQNTNPVKSASEQTLPSRGIHNNKATELLNRGTQSDTVRDLQEKLGKLGFFTGEVTGYYGDATVIAVKRFQKKNGLLSDGVAGEQTQLLIDRLILNGNYPQVSDPTLIVIDPIEDMKVSANKKQEDVMDNESPRMESSVKSKVESDSNNSTKYELPWFGEVEKIFSIGSVATIYDIGTGMSFKIKRTYGYNHADCETFTSKDTAIMKKIYGGSWNWARRPVIVKVKDRIIAASMAGMPHAGLDNAAEGSYVTDRSGEFGYGYNLDLIKGNDMDGHFDVHFLGSKTHGSDIVDEMHHQMIQQAAQWSEINY